MSTLLFNLQLKDGFGNTKYLRVRRNNDYSVSYALRGARLGTGFSLNNLQVKQPLPIWAGKGEDGLDLLLERIISSLSTGVMRYTGHETSPHATDTEGCPHCGGEL